jgi:glycosyltransferase involved in cell wall biosynthesis
MGRLELRMLGKWARRIMILNPGMVEEAEAAGLPPQLLLWMPNPVDAAEFAPCEPARRAELRARLGIPEDALTVVYAGRLAPEKELASLVRAFALVAREIPAARLVLIGDGPLREKLEALAAMLDVSGTVRFTGRQPAGEVRAWLQASDAFALASSNEGFPCSLLEAMSVGLPSVVSAIHANVQLIDDGVHGLHAALRDESAIAAALTRLLRSERERARMGAAARARVLENYSTEKVVARYEALFEEMTE